MHIDETRPETEPNHMKPPEYVPKTAKSLEQCVILTLDPQLDVERLILFGHESHEIVLHETRRSPQMKDIFKRS